MAQKTEIEWTDATWNPVAGCTKVGPGCDNLIGGAIQPLDELGSFLSKQYEEIVGVAPSGTEAPLNQLMIDHYGHFHTSTIEALEPWLANHRYIGERIAKRRDFRSAFRMPGILLAYFFADTEPYRTKKDGPLPDSELGLVFGDLGQSLDG